MRRVEEKPVFNQKISRPKKILRVPLTLRKHKKIKNLFKVVFLLIQEIARSKQILRDRVKYITLCFFALFFAHHVHKRGVACSFPFGGSQCLGCPTCADQDYDYEDVDDDI